MMTATNYVMGYYRHCVIALHTLSYFILLTPQRDWNCDYHLHFTKEEIWLVLANPGVILTHIFLTPELLTIALIFIKEPALVTYEASWVIELETLRIEPSDC